VAGSAQPFDVSDDDLVVATSARAVDLISEHTGNYYLLGYTPTSKPRDLHEIKVSVGRPGVSALTRRARGA
jgi:hypothetical protein